MICRKIKPANIVYPYPQLRSYGQLIAVSEGTNHCYLDVWLPVGCSCFSVWQQSHAHMGSTAWALVIVQTTRKTWGWEENMLRVS